MVWWFGCQHASHTIELHHTVLDATTIVIILHFIMVTLVLIRAGVGRGRVLM